MVNSVQTSIPARILFFTLYYSLFTPFAFSAKPHEDVRNELPAPVALQAVILKNTITLTWQWTPPEVLPVFTQFGYEVKRSDGKTFLALGAMYADEALAPGSYSYVVRVHGLAKDKGKRVTYVSDWTEPVAGTIKTTCSQQPTVTLSVEPTQKAYSSVSSLRFHMVGQASQETGCTLGSVNYHLDTGTGITHGGPLPVDAQGHFDTFVNAFGPDDEIPSGHVSFSLTASAENEAGPTTSAVYTVDVELRNPFAPH